MSLSPLDRIIVIKCASFRRRWDCIIRHSTLQKRGEFKVIVSPPHLPWNLMVLNVHSGSLLGNSGAVSLARCTETRPD